MALKDKEIWNLNEHGNKITLKIEVKEEELKILLKQNSELQKATMETRFHLQQSKDERRRILKREEMSKRKIKDCEGKLVRFSNKLLMREKKVGGLERELQDSLLKAERFKNEGLILGRK